MFKGLFKKNKVELGVEIVEVKCIITLANGKKYEEISYVKNLILNKLDKCDLTHHIVNHKGEIFFETAKEAKVFKKDQDNK